MVRTGAVVRVACCALGISSCRAAAAEYAEDASTLVQEGVRAHQHQAASSEAGISRVQVVASLASGQMPRLPPFDCDKFPKLCQHPFNCQAFDGPGFFAKMIADRGLAAKGEADLRSWCLAPFYDEYISTCLVKKDLAKAGQLLYQRTWNQHIGLDEVDGSFCFIEGHCTNEAVTNATTVEESYQMCDERLGPSGWRNFGSLGSLPDIISSGASLPKPKDYHGGFHEKRHTQLYLKASCAMGNYHCDVMYCKETYCKNPYYVKKFGHLLPSAPGHLIQDKLWLD